MSELLTNRMSSNRLYMFDYMEKSSYFSSLSRPGTGAAYIQANKSSTVPEYLALKLKSLVAAALMVVAAPSMASVINLGDLSVPGLTAIGNQFSGAGVYRDDYTFRISQSATAGGLVLEIDSLLNTLDIDVTGVTLTGGGSSYAPDLSPLTYDFGFLSAGSYTLSIFSTVTNDRGLFSSSVGYIGLLSLGATRSTSVPEPGTLALLGAGLMGMAFAMRRRTIRS